MADQDNASAWARLTHQRALLRAAAQAFTNDPAEVLTVLKDLVRLCDPLGARRLEVVAALARKRMALLHGEGRLQQRILFELVDAVEKAYFEALAAGANGDPALLECAP